MAYGQNRGASGRTYGSKRGAGRPGAGGSRGGARSYGSRGGESREDSRRGSSASGERAGGGFARQSRDEQGEVQSGRRGSGSRTSAGGRTGDHFGGRSGDGTRFGNRDRSASGGQSRERSGRGGRPGGRPATAGQARRDLQSVGPRRRRDEALDSPVRDRAGRANGNVSPADSAEETVSASLILGRHPVLEALKSGRSINKVMVAEKSEGGSLIEILGKAKAAGVVVQTVPRAHLDDISDGQSHQGVAAYAAPHDYVELDEIQARKTGQAPLVVLLDEVADPYNLGAILRTAEATGVQGVVIPKRRAVPLTETVGKAAAGAMEYMPVARVANLIQAMEQLKSQGYWIVGTDVDATEDYTEVDYKGPIAIVIGAEGKGLSRLVKERCDYTVSLPMLGNLQSLNASVATGVLLYEVVRQRR